MRRNIKNTCGGLRGKDLSLLEQKSAVTRQERQHPFRMFLRHLDRIAVIGGKIKVTSADPVESYFHIKDTLFHRLLELLFKFLHPSVIGNVLQWKKSYFDVFRQRGIILPLRGMNHDTVSPFCGAFRHPQHIPFQSPERKIFQYGKCNPHEVALS